MTVPVYFDYSGVAHACWSVAVKSIENGSTFDLAELFHHNLMLKIRSVSDELKYKGYKNVELIFVKDDDSLRKIMLCPEYKANRNGNEIPMNAAAEFIAAKGWGRFCQSPGNEADDAICSLVTDMGGIIVTADHDLWQLINDDTRVFSPFTKQFITKSDIEKSFNFTEPKHIPLHKTIFGDYGDGVKNLIPRMQRHLIPIIKSSNGSLEDFRSELQKNWWVISQRCRDLCAENDLFLDINWQLVKLDNQCEIVWE